MAADLKNLSILVTRPEPLGIKLCELLNSEGANAIYFPTIAFTKPDDDLDAMQPLIPLQDWLIFVSPQAVIKAMPFIFKHQQKLPENIQLASIGAGTAKQLMAAGFSNITHPKPPWNSESLLAMPAFQAVSKQNIMVVRGEGGRELLEKTLIERGANLTSLIVYKRVLPDKIHLPTVDFNALQAIVVTSFDGINHLRILVGSAWPSLQKMPFIVISDRLKALAEDLGCKTIWVTPDASDAAILQLLVQKKDVLCQMKI